MPKLKNSNETCWLIFKHCEFDDWIFSYDLWLFDLNRIRRAQPDNREQREGGEDEACIAVLNNFYADGIKWHDVNCDHKKPIICEEIPELLDFVNDQ